MNYSIFQKHGDFELRTTIFVHYTMSMKLVFNIAK